MHPVVLHRTLSHQNDLALKAAPKERRSVRGWLRNASRAWRQRKMIAALRSMDDPMLAKLGIHRSRITSIVEGLDERELLMMLPAPEMTGATNERAPVPTAL